MKRLIRKVAWLVRRKLTEYLAEEIDDDIKDTLKSLHTQEADLRCADAFERMASNLRRSSMDKVRS